MVLTPMAQNLDLSCADEDYIWAKDGQLLVDEAYQLLYDCQRQLRSPLNSLTPDKAEVPTSSPSLIAADNAFTSDLISLPKVRQVPPLPPRSRPFRDTHVPGTIPPCHRALADYYDGTNLERSPPSGFSLPPSDALRSRVSIPGAGQNRTSSEAARSNRREKCWKTRVDKPSCVLGTDILVDRVLGLMERARVGKFCYANTSMR